MILDNLKTAGVQQAHKEGRIAFTALTPWPGELVVAEGRYLEGEGAATRLFTTEDRAEGLRAFLDKREAEFRGR